MDRLMSRSSVEETLLLLFALWLLAETGLVVSTAVLVSVVEAAVADSAGGVTTKAIGVAPAATVSVPKLQVSTPVPALNALPAPQPAGWPPVRAEPTGRFTVNTTLVASDGPVFIRVRP